MNEDFEVLLTDKRYEMISKIIQATTIKGKRKWTISDMLDKAFLDKYVGMPIFLAMFWAMFTFTYACSVPFMEMINMAFVWLGEQALQIIPNEYLAAFIGEGLIGGIGFVIVFAAPIAFLFLSIALLEDSGYLARAAFVMDRPMYRIGLTGRSFIPMLLGFGCNVPAMMATRSIEDRKDRLLTLIINPFISCSARLPIYILFAAAFFTQYAVSVIWSMYILGIIIAILSALLLRKTLFKGEPAPFILELPIFRRPTLKSAAIHMWDRTSVFVRKVFTYLLVGAVLLWLLSAFPWGAGVENSYVAMIGKAIEPIFRPLGFGWRGSVAFIFGFLAKEVVVETFAILFAVEGEAATAIALRGVMTPLVGYAFMAFSLLYMPCLAVFGVLRKETGSWKWTGFAAIYGLVIAYFVAAVIIAVGTLLGFA